MLKSPEVGMYDNQRRKVFAKEAQLMRTDGGLDDEVVVSEEYRKKLLPNPFPPSKEVKNANARSVARQSPDKTVRFTVILKMKPTCPEGVSINGCHQIVVHAARPSPHFPR
jgi:hypothetical protein